jgi:chromosome segregation ATPase
MSSIGKIFVVVNLVLSLLLLGSLGALLNASRSTKEDVTALQLQLTDSQAAATQTESDYNARKRILDNDKQQLENENNDLEVQRDNAQTNADRESTNNQQLRDDLSKLTANYELQQQDLSAKEGRNRDLQASNDDLRTQSQDSQDDAREAELARRDLEGEIAGYQSRSAS